jgi:hypothetical protein
MAKVKTVDELVAGAAAQASTNPQVSATAQAQAHIRAANALALIADALIAILADLKAQKKRP